MTRKSVAEEIRQTRPFRDKAAEGTVALLRTANLIRRRGEAITMQEGITLQQYNILRILRGARGPLPTMEIAARLIEQAPGITRLVNVLEERGFLRREPWSGDRRQILCQITTTGSKLLERLDDAIDAYDSASMGNLTPAQIQQLIHLLDEIRDANSD